MTERNQTNPRESFRYINSHSVAANLAAALTIHNFCIRISKNTKINASIVSQLKYTSIEE